MTTVNVTKKINVSADKAWHALSTFRGIENYSPIERSVTEGEGAGAKRTCFLPDGAAINETLNFADGAKKEMQYIITEGPFPISHYVSDIKVSAVDAKSAKIAWSCEFDSAEEVKEDMEKLFEGFYVTIIDSLEQYLN